MGKEKKLYYKRPTKAKDGNIYFDKQRLVIKTPELEAATQIALVQFSEAEPKTLIHRMGVAYIEDSHYNNIRKEINFTSIPEGDGNDYITIWSDDDIQLFMLRPASRRMMDTIEFEAWEAKEKLKTEAIIAEQEKNFKENNP